uniref:Inner membrane protein p54 n=1 Tax=African swine fever virus TaxID=10497 RepID=D9UBA4_ASF|nr:p54 structural protein [African swine fever virus]
MDSEFFQPVYIQQYVECLSPVTPPSFSYAYRCFFVVNFVVLTADIVLRSSLCASRKKKAAAAIAEEDIQFINPYQDQQWAEVSQQPGTSKPAGATTASAGKPVTGRPATNRPATNKPVTDNPVTDRLVMATGGPAAAPAAASAHPTEPYTTVTTQNTASQTMSAIENLRQRTTYTHKDLENSL